MSFVRQLLKPFRLLETGCLFLLVWLWADLNVLKAEPEPVISTVNKYYSYPSGAFAKGVYIRIKAAVTYYDDEYHHLYIQDSTGGMFIDLRETSSYVPCYNTVLLEGVSTIQNQQRRVRNIRIQPLGEIGSPMERPATARELFELKNGSCLVRVEGTVLSYSEDDRLFLRLKIDDRIVPAIVKNYIPSDLKGLFGAKICMTAVCSQGFDTQGHITIVTLLAQGHRNYVIQEPGKNDPFDFPLLTVDDAKMMALTNNNIVRVRMKGVVIKWPSKDEIDFCDGTGFIRARISFWKLNPVNKQMEISGVLKKENRFVYLDDVVAQNIGTPHPTLIPAENKKIVLTQITDIRNLTTIDASKNLPVHLTGIVTYYDANRQNLFISENGYGIAVVSSQSMNLIPGDRVEVTGITMPGDGLPYISKTKIKVLGNGPQPIPMPLSYAEAASGTNDCQWGEIAGTVRSVEEREGTYYLKLITENGGEFECWLSRVNSPKEVTELPTSSVILRGICANQISESRRLNGFTFRLQDESCITKQGQALEFECSIGDINRITPSHFGTSRFKIRGTVTLSESTDFYIQDKTGGIRVTPSSSTQMTMPGDVIEVTGTRDMLNFTPFLNNATIRNLEKRTPIAKSENIQNLASGGCEGELVVVKAQLLENVSSQYRPQFYVQAGREIFDVTISGLSGITKCNSMKKGSTLALTGVCTISRITPADIKSFHLMLRTPDDIRILWQPPESINWKRIILFFAFLIFISMATLVWIVSLRRQVRLQTRQISERLQREAALEARLQQSQKMESVGQLAAGIAHDFNNILTVIQGYASLLSSTPEASKEIHESSESIVQASERAAELTRQLLTFSRQQPMQLRILDIHEVLTSVSKLLHRLLTESVALDVIVDANLPLLKADSGMIQQVIINLAVNARDAMPNGGTLEIHVMAKWISPDEAIAPDRAGSYICITVRDTGKGMSREVMARIFEPFFTTKGVGKGTGLGLATVLGIVQQHGGWIDVSSEIGKGTLFEVYFPSCNTPHLVEKPC